MFNDNSLYHYLHNKGYQLNSEKGVANGYAALDANTQLPTSYGQHMLYDGGIIGITEAGDDPAISYDGGEI